MIERKYVFFSKKGKDGLRHPMKVHPFSPTSKKILEFKTLPGVYRTLYLINQNLTS